MTKTRWIAALGVLVMVALPADALAGGTQTFINISGTATAAGGTITVTLKEQGGAVIGSYSYTVANGDNYEKVAKGLRNSGNVVGYTDSKGNAKTEGGVRHGVFKIKTKRGGGAFTANVVENIPGIQWSQKGTYHATRRLTVQGTVGRGFGGIIDLLGTDTTWLSDNITGLDFGVGIELVSLNLVSDSLIQAQVNVAPDAPLGPEHVDVIGDAIDDNGDPDIGIFLDSSSDPLHVNESAPIPTMSEWGLIIMMLLLLTAGTVVIGRRSRPAAA